jgi:DNA-binding CsgD family transcriptional regulator
MAKKDLLGEEMEAQDQFNGEAPTADEAATEAKDVRVWTNAEGQEVSKSEFIREQFTKHNLGRKEISESFDINYRTVYGATVNMVNEAEPATRGRSASNQKIAVTTEGHVVTVIEGTIHVDNIAVSDEEGAALVTSEVDRNTWIKEQVEAGKSRGDVANALGLSYGVVYSLTKEVEGASQRHEIEYNGEVLSRSEYIRRRFAEGIAKAEIAKELGVDYPVVWSALKSLKSEADKFTDAVEKLSKFADKFDEAQAAVFASLIEQLNDLEVKVEVKPEAAEEVAVME